MGVYQDWTQTTVFNKPILSYPQMGNYSPFDVPLRLTGYKNATRTPKTIQVQSIPAITTNTAYQGVALGMGSSELPKIQLQGTIDTPVKDDGNGNMIPTLIRDQSPMTYADLIAMCLEGRYVQGNINDSVEPTLFRDPFGRVYYSPHVVNFTANYIEAVPGRTDFTMILRI